MKKKAIRKAGIAALGIAIGIITIAAVATTATNSIDDPQVQMKGADANGIEAISLVYRTPATEPTETSAPNIAKPEQKDIEMIAKLIWGEARGVKSTTEKAAVVWCVLNRVDADGYACGGDIEWVITYPGQFCGYNEDNPATSDDKAIAEDVLTRWYAEKAGIKEAGRVLPADYIFFFGDGKQNYFTTEYQGTEYWDWSLESPYQN